MLRYHAITRKAAKEFQPYGKYTVAARKSGDLAEAHRQTRNGQLKAMGKEMLPLPNEETERREYAEQDRHKSSLKPKEEGADAAAVKLSTDAAAVFKAMNAIASELDEA